MMDLVMAAVLLMSFGLLKLFTDWCSRQVDTVGKEEV